MPKIIQISFKNYRAFWGDKNKLKIDGKNALIYGENGSGKSSLYQGLKDFFKAVDQTWTIHPSPIHLKAKENEYEVKVTFKNPKKSISFDGQPIDDETVAQTFLLNSFLSYKEMLRTHFLEKNEIFEEKFFELLADTLLKEHEIGGSTIGDALKDLQSKLSEPTDKSELLEKIRETRPDAEEEDLEEIDPKAEIENFKTLFDEKLEEISAPLNEILSYFKQAITVKFENLRLTFDEKENKLKGELGLDVKYIEIDHINHLEILNEARLSAIAISIYLAAIVTNPIVQKANYKILFLDDVFIGLDTSNRLPLLQLLQRFSVDGKKLFFEDFQIFITTYDRYWFELAKKHLSNSWITAEMYVGEKIEAGKKLFDKPVIVQDLLEPLEKAEKLFESFDYYSAGNFLRKALEKRLETLVNATYRIEAGDLEGTITKLLKYYDDCECGDLISDELRSKLKMYKDSVLNPSSHYDLKSPLYKAEIETTIEMIKSLQKLPVIKKIPLLYKNSSLFYINDENNYEAEYILKSDIYIIKVDDKLSKISDAKHSIISWSVNNHRFAKLDGSISSDEEIKDKKGKTILLSKRAEKIEHFLSLSEVPDWKEFTNIEGKTITQLANEI